MNNSDIFTEVDSIMSEGKYAIEENLFSYIRLKTNMQLHGYKVYEDSKYNAWRIFDESGNVMSFPFGFIAVDIFNQLNSLKSEDAFLNYEKRIRTGAPKNESTNATFDKPFIFHLFNHGSSGDKIGEYKRQDSIETYNKFSILYGYIQSELDALIECVKFVVNNDVSMNDIAQIYRFSRRFIFEVVTIMLRINDGTINEDETEYIIKDLHFDDDKMLEFIRYIGYEELLLNNGQYILCKKYDVTNLTLFFADDLMKLLTNECAYTFGFCERCNNIFVVTHKSQKYCPACKKDARNEKRKDDPARYLHKKITDILNMYYDTSEDFRNESNYYWAIVQGKKPKVEKESWYSDDIKSYDQYLQWLQDKKNEISADKNNL